MTKAFASGEGEHAIARRRAGLALSIIGALLLILGVVLPFLSGRAGWGASTGAVIGRGFVLNRICDRSGEDCTWARQVQTERLGQRYWMWVWLGRGVFVLGLMSATGAVATAVRSRRPSGSGARIRRRLVAWGLPASTLVGAVLWAGPAWPPSMTNVFDLAPASGSAALLLGAVAAVVGSAVVTVRRPSNG